MSGGGEMPGKTPGLAAPVARLPLPPAPRPPPFSAVLALGDAAPAGEY